MYNQNTIGKKVTLSICGIGRDERPLIVGNKGNNKKKYRYKELGRVIVLLLADIYEA